MTELQLKDKTYIASTYNRFPVDLVSGKGSLFYDANGKEYIDMGSGIGVTAFGACDEEYVSAVTSQLNALQHTSNLYYTSPCATLAEMLVKKSGLKKVFFANSGAEANECAIKCARKYAEDKGVLGSVIITLEQSFHGRTITTLSATGQDSFHKNFLPLTDGFKHVPKNDLNAIKEIAKNQPVSAVMIELIQGEGGVICLDKNYVLELYSYCKQNDILLIVDEVQTGNGRTGSLYAYMNYGILPDIVTTAKGLGGGLPIGACMLGEKVEETFTFGTHGSTFGGNPVCSAGAISILNRLTPEFLSEVNAKSELIFKTLENAEGVESVSGMGLMVGIKTKKPVKEVVSYCIENGVLPLIAKDKLRLLPALNIPTSTLKKALGVILNALK
ncbi:MAG: acetylornithine/succinylornithine family transaminase [Clostridia bacterium]|nr:acetylornithine/succinylornithine family transaminase [Clostridia bacterium]